MRPSAHSCSLGDSSHCFLASRELKLLSLFNHFFDVDCVIFMLYGLKLLVIAIATVPAALLTVLFGLFDPHGKRVYGITRFWTWMVLAVGGVTVKITGLSQIDPKQQYIFMVNHQSNIDIPVLMQSLPGFQLRWIAKRELLWAPFLGWAMWAAKHITVDRSDRLNALGTLKKAKERMKGGICLVVFPEGTRSNDESLLPFKRGGFLLAVKTQTPIVPVTISGSGMILHKGDWRIRRGEIAVIVGAPVPVRNHRPGALPALSARVHEVIGTNLRMASRLARAKSEKDQPNNSLTPSVEKPTV
jgi:1-acyl-sn-glycerol-3-phosphate acyltransferase